MLDYTEGESSDELRKCLQRTQRIIKDDALATITFTRPDEMNRFDVTQEAEFIDALKFLRRAEDGLRVVILAEVLELRLQLEAMTMAPEDTVEAATAFIEKRPGIFRGR